MLAGTLGGVLVSTLLAVPPAVAVEPKPVPLRGQADEVDTRGSEVTGVRPAQRTIPALDLPPVVWPKAGSARAVIRAGGRAKAGALPVSVAKAAGAAGDRLPEDITVEVIDRARTPELWRDGVVLRVGGAAGTTTAGTAAVTVDYSGFKHAYGADWASRLQVWQLPQCALTTPESSRCTARPLPTVNDTAASTVSADAVVEPIGGTGAALTREQRAGDAPVPTAAGTLLAVTAGPSGPSGDFAATSLSASSTWTAGGNSGSFSWSYNIESPPVAAGKPPTVGISYSSSSVDGRSSASNNQPSWIGEGFELGSGFIERAYVPCREDIEGGSNNTKDTLTGDMCWRTDNASMSLNGSATELVYEEGKGWHGRSRDGSRIEKLTGASNGALNGEHWKVTSTDGTQYYFGLNNLPGHSAGTSSAWTVPVYGNHAGEPCHQTGFTDSVCDQAYRWNLDYVVDIHGNTTSYWYTKELNQYATRGTDTENVDYVRGGTLDRIDYGTWDRGANDRSTAARAQIDFDTADRCISSACSSHDGETWPDVPWDQECVTTATECTTYSPTFWSTKRLSKVTTRVWDPAKTGGAGWQDVASWALTHSFPSPGDGGAAGLWLSSIVKTGLVGGSIALPPVTFEPEPMPNRVLTKTNTTNSWQRLSKVINETGATTHVTYSLPECTASNLPATYPTNGMRCYPVLGPDPARPGYDMVEWWHKYVVTSVTETDLQLKNGAQSPPMVTSYEYEGNPAWHFADDNGLVRSNRKTWNQWRGYATVATRVGAGNVKSLTRTTFLRGMHGDRASMTGGTRTVTVNASLGSETVYDEDAFAGMTRETVTYNGTIDKPISKNVDVPWQSPPTASRTINGDTVTARYVGTAASYTATALGVDGSRGWRTTRTRTTTDPVYGTTVSVQDDGDLAITGDESCVTNTYSRNTARNLVSLPKRVVTTALPCGATPESADDIVSDSRTYYDKATSVDAVPVIGDVTKVEQLKNWTKAGGTEFETVSTASFDAFGRAMSSTDIKGNATTTAYTPASGGPVTKVTTTNHLGWTSSVETNPYWGSTTSTIDPNNKVTSTDYDPLGRVIRAWDTGWTKTAHANDPRARFSYHYSADRSAYPYIKSEVLHAGGGYTTTYTILDGLLRERQMQTPALDGSDARVVTDTLYDEWGRVEATYSARQKLGVASGTFWYDHPWSVPAVNKTVYDLAGRPTSTILLAPEGDTNQVEKWRTTTVHEGDRTLVTPPPGGTATTTITDVYGRTTELRTHTTAAGVAGDYTATTYTHNRKGQLTKVVDAGKNEWVYTYDIKGRQTTAKDPDAGTTTTTYNAYDEIQNVTNGAGEVVHHTYDSLGRKTALRDDSATGALRAEWKYDETYGGDLFKGQLTETIRYDASNSKGTTAAYKWQARFFNDRYQVTSANYVIPSVETGVSGTWVFGYGHSPYNGEAVSTTYPPAGGLANEMVTTTFHEGSGLPNTLKTSLPSIGTYVVNQLYTAYGEPTLARRKIGTGDYIENNVLYDTTTRRVTDTTVKLQNAVTAVADTRYKQDPAGNILAVSEKPGTADAETQCFTYDALRRMTSAWTPKAGIDCGSAPSVADLGGPAPYWTDWTIDDLGNRTKQVSHNPTGDTVTTYGFPASGANAVRPHAVTSTTTVAPGAAPVTRPFTYDSAGNTVSRYGTSANQTLTWDAEGHLAKTVENSDTHTYVYDADGTRLIRRDLTGITLYLPGMEVRRATGATTSTATRYYTFDGSVVASRTGTAIDSLSWVYNDHHNTQNLTINSVSHAVTVRRQTPYGADRGTPVTWPNEKTFVGGDKDRTGLIHIGAREYDAGLGRFISVDPIMDLADPQQWNGYAYANNSPITSSDPTGLRTDYFDPCNCNGKPPTPAPVAQNPLDSPIPIAVLPQWAQDGIRSNVMYNGTERLSWQEVIDWSKISTDNWMYLCQSVGGSYEHCSTHPEIVNRQSTSDALLITGFILGSFVCTAAIVACVRGIVSIADEAAEFAATGSAISTGLITAEVGIAGGAGLTAAGAAAKLFCSFSGDTRVLMADGSSKEIADIEVGDEVAASDPETGESGARKVTHLWPHRDDLVLVRIDGEALKATEDHLVWNASDRQWQRMDEVDAGDALLTPSGRPAILQDIEYGFSFGAAAYDLTVDGLHTYYVLAGNTPVLVHNDGGGGLQDNIRLYGDYTARMDQFNVRGQASFEIHVYHRGTEVGIYGSNGFFNKHNINANDVNVPDQVHNRLKGIAVDQMRKIGQIPADANIKGDAWKRPMIGSSGGGC
ncbi:RHS repeat-associated core domain-containing protein [Catenuloplanes niger JCM 9533]